MEITNKLVFEHQERFNTFKPLKGVSFMFESDLATLYCYEKGQKLNYNLSNDKPIKIRYFNDSKIFKYQNGKMEIRFDDKMNFKCQIPIFDNQKYSLLVMNNKVAFNTHYIIKHPANNTTMDFYSSFFMGDTFGTVVTFKQDNGRGVFVFNDNTITSFSEIKFKRFHFGACVSFSDNFKLPLFFYSRMKFGSIVLKDLLSVDYQSIVVKSVISIKNVFKSFDIHCNGNYILNGQSIESKISVVFSSKDKYPIWGKVLYDGNIDYIINARVIPQLQISYGNNNAFQFKIKTNSKDKSSLLGFLVQKLF